MRCPICNSIAGEIKDKNGTSYHCTYKNCTWSGEYEVNKDDDDKKKK